MGSLVYELNKKYYDSPGVPDSYARRTNLFEAEEAILSRIGDEIQDGRLLDIGVGQGRTTPHLSASSRCYVGTDYSANMLSLCRLKHPDVSLALCDARRMAFAAGSFDAVYFSWNAIDDADQEERLFMLREVSRVLKPGGIFFFSSHNLDREMRSHYAFRDLLFCRNPFDFIRVNGRRLVGWVAGIVNHVRLRSSERREENYSIINEPILDSRLLTYYIKKEEQARQLENVGFGDVGVVGLDGTFLKPEDRSGDPWLFYIARKN